PWCLTDKGRPVGVVTAAAEGQSSGHPLGRCLASVVVDLPGALGVPPHQLAGPPRAPSRDGLNQFGMFVPRVRSTRLVLVEMIIARELEAGEHRRPLASAAQDAPEAGGPAGWARGLAW